LPNSGSAGAVLAEQRVTGHELDLAADAGRAERGDPRAAEPPVIPAGQVSVPAASPRVKPSRVSPPATTAGSCQGQGGLAAEDGSGIVSPGQPEDKRNSTGRSAVP
jgi:hypothetical protein